VRGLITVDKSPIDERRWRHFGEQATRRSDSSSPPSPRRSTIGEHDSASASWRDSSASSTMLQRSHLALVESAAGRNRGPSCRPGRSCCVREQAESAGCGRITGVLVERVTCPGSPSTRWDELPHVMGARQSYSSNTRATGCCSTTAAAFAELGESACRPSGRWRPSSIRSMRLICCRVDAPRRASLVATDLLDLRRLAGAVIALDHDAAVEGEAGADRQRVSRRSDRPIGSGHIEVPS